MDYTKVIYAKKGVYKEKLIIPSWLTNITICGEDRDQTIITWDDHANILMPIGGLDSEASAKGKKMGNLRTYTLKVQGNYITLKRHHHRETMWQNLDKQYHSTLKAIIFWFRTAVFWEIRIPYIPARQAPASPSTTATSKEPPISSSVLAWHEFLKIARFTARQTVTLQPHPSPAGQKYGYVFNKCRANS